MAHWIWVEVENEAPGKTRVAYIVKAKARFKQASTATGVDVAAVRVRFSAVPPPDSSIKRTHVTQQCPFREVCVSV